MPTRPHHQCAHPGCRILITDGPRCDKHKSAANRQYDSTTRRDDPRLATAKKIRSSAQWREVELLHKALNPLCCDPFKEHGERHECTQQSHHVVPLIDDPTRAFDMTNIAPVCTACHSTVESMERAGKRTAHLFEGMEIRTPFGPILIVTANVTEL